MTKLSQTSILIVVVMLFGVLVYGPASKNVLDHSVQAAKTLDPLMAPQHCGLGRLWVTGEVNWFGNWGWQGVWTRRGDSNVFDATWTRINDRLQLKDVITITIQGNSVYVSRPNCEYTGTFETGVQIRGKMRCTGTPWNDWAAAITCEGGSGGGGGGAGSGGGSDFVPLELWWSAARGDNFSTATDAGKGAARAAGYQFARIEGYIYKTQQSGTVPLELWWSAARGDNFTTATDKGKGAARAAGYTFARVEGYIFPTYRDGTVELKNYWSASRADNFTTATREGQQAAEYSGYKFTWTEGYIFPARGSADGAIQVVSGTYGANCGQAEGNVTSHLAAACNGKKQCNYVIDYTVIGDPKYGCAKNYIAKWRCGNGSAVQTAEVSPEAGGRRTVSLSCGA